jgi:hypothetical protein
MNIVNGILYVASALFVLFGVFAVLPLSALNTFLGWFEPFAYPGPGRLHHQDHGADHGLARRAHGLRR